ncbi:MAG: DUF3237 domain-containing protein [Polyangiales bacterium]
MLITRPLFTFELAVAAPVDITQETRVIPLGEGRVSGIFEGRILAGGADWQRLHADGSLEISARYVLERADGARVEVRSDGVRTGSPEVLAALAQGHAVPAEQYYFRTHMRFSTDVSDLRRLNHVLAVSVGERQATRVRLSVHEVL